jgi:DNA-binding winged helix-turn-helix (wHTH) protein/tetratricopeptide (TPR) repeat protein/TolB-like protein
MRVIDIEKKQKNGRLSSTQSSQRESMRPNSAAESSVSYQFGPFRLEPNPGLLYCRDEIVSITPKAFGILLVLVKNHGAVVSRNELIEQVWSDTFVEDSNVTKNISILRGMLSKEFPDCEPIRTLSKRGYQLTIPVSEAAPADRITSLPEDPEAPAQPAPRPSPPRPFWAKFGSAAVVGVGVLLLVVWNLRALVVPAAPPRIPVAVIGFHDLTGRPETAWLSQALSEMLVTELEGDAKLRALPGDQAARLRSDLSLPNVGSFSPEILARIRKASSCNYVVTGGYLPFDGKVRLDIRLQDTAKGEDSMVVSFTEAEKNLPDLAVRAAAEIRRHFGIAPLSESEEARRRSSTPSDIEARVLYAQALEKLRAFDPGGAKTLLEEVTAKEPNFALGHVQLSTALSMLGYDQAARAEAKRAFDLSSQLPRDERLEVDARNFEAAGNWERAADIYRSLWTFFPDDAQFGLSLARIQTLAGKPADAERTIARLRAAPGTHDEASISLAAGAAASARGDYPKASTEFTAAIAQAKAKGSRLAEGHAQAGEALVLTKMGEGDRAQEAFREAVRLCTEAGDTGCVAEALNNQASALRGDGKYEEGIDATNRALQLARRDGNQRQIGKALNIRGAIEDLMGKYRQASATLEECLSVARQLSDIRLQAIALHRLGSLESQTGDSVSATKRFAEEINLARQGDDKLALANALDSQGRLQQRRGDLVSARNNLEAALNLKRESGDYGSIASAIGPLATLAKNQGDLAAARKLRTEECQIVAQKQPSRLSRCQLFLAELDLFEGRFREAEATASAIAATARKFNPGADAWRILALAQLGMGNARQAHESIVKAQAFAAQTPDLINYGIPVGIAAARIETALGHRRPAAGLLKQALAEANKADVASLILDVRLAMAEADLKEGGRNAAFQLAGLKKEAGDRGYGLIASQAEKFLLANRQASLIH